MFLKNTIVLFTKERSHYIAKVAMKGYFDMEAMSNSNKSIQKLLNVSSLSKFGLKRHIEKFYEWKTFLLRDAFSICNILQNSSMTSYFHEFKQYIIDTKYFSL